MNGIVLNVPVKVGTSVSGSSSFSEGTTIATVANMNDIIFSGNIDETEVAKLHVGMDVTPHWTISLQRVPCRTVPECLS